jgi:hypothetical protein
MRGQLRTCVGNTIALESSSCLPTRSTENGSRDIGSQCLRKKRNGTDIVLVTSLMSINSRGTVVPKRVSCQLLCPFNISLCTTSEKGKKRT